MSQAPTNQHQAQSLKGMLVPLVTIIVGLFMVILDTTAVNVALHSLSQDFHRPLSTVQWAVTGYMLAQASVIPLAGWLSDRFGAKYIFLTSIGLFTLGSVLCSLSDSANQLIFFRVLQGLGGGMVMPIAMSFTYRLSPPGKVGAAMGVLGVPILIAPAAGPVLSGYLVLHASWHWIFLINLPIGIIGIFLGIFTLPNIERSTVAGLDVLGMIFGPIAFAALAYGISEGSTSWSSVHTILGLSIGGAALIAFVVTELTRKKQPLLELRVFFSGNFTRGIIVQWVAQVALFGTIFLVPQFLQGPKGDNAFQAGLTILPQPIFAGIFMAIGGRLFDKFGARPVAFTGMILVSAAGFLLSRVAGNGGDSLSMILPLALLGSGMGLAMMPLNTHLIQAAPQNLVSRVTSLTAAFQMIMNSFAVAGLVTILTRHIKDNLAAGDKQIGALTSAFSSTFLVVIGVGLLGMILSIMLRRPKLHHETRTATSKSEMAALD